MIDSFENEFLFLSNFYPARVQFEKHSFATVEHGYQAAKTLDLSWRKLIRDAPTPARAKKLGRQSPLRSDWETVKLDVMRMLLVQKFSDRELKKLLLDTDDEILVEGNTWHDNFWGVCQCGECKDGNNHLGLLLMEIRDELKQK